MKLLPSLRAIAQASALALLLIAAQAVTAHATQIQRVVSPGGVEAWLVQDASVPVIAIDYAFAGGAAQDPAGKAGTANLVSQLLDEGAGDLDAHAFHERLERHAIEMSFRTSRDFFRGSIRTLSENRDEAATLLKLALTAPRFDDEAVGRMRAQITTALQRQTTSPSDLASDRWAAIAFRDHPYANPTEGTLDTVPGITKDDLRNYTKRVLARDGLKIAVVGDIDAESLKPMLDTIFGSLPAKADLTGMKAINPQGLGQRIDIAIDVPQSVIIFGGQGIARDDPDFMTAYIVNHILGGGTFSSRFYREVREKRGLVYSVSQSLVWYAHSAIFLGMTATRADRTNETIAVIEAEIKRMAEEGPTQKEIDDAKAYLKGSQMLSLDTSSKIARQLVQYQIDHLGIDYIDRRNGLIDAVKLADAKRVAKRLFGNGLLVTVAGPAAAAAAAPKGN